MFWKILQWVQIVISLIREAEDKLGAGRGREKRDLVVAAATRELEQLTTAVQLVGCPVEVYVTDVGKLVDSVVSLLNCLGIFVGGTGGIRTAAATEAAPLAPEK